MMKLVHVHRASTYLKYISTRPSCVIITWFRTNLSKFHASNTLFDYKGVVLNAFDVAFVHYYLSTL